MLLGGIEEMEERESGYLFPNDFIIFDEAHTVEQVASRQIGIARFAIWTAGDGAAALQRAHEERLFTVTRDAAGRDSGGGTG